MPVKPPLYLQETDYSCAPACLRMVLAAAGIEKAEEELREISGCTLEGTEALAIVDAARSFGFQNTRKYNLDFDELKSSLAQNLYPIAYIKTRTGSQKLLQQHAVVVIEIKPGKVFLLDPAPERGEIEMAEAEFLQAWSAMRRLTILVA